MADNLKPIISTKQATRKINDVTTDLVCSNFGDQLFILVTQYGKIGTLVHISKDIYLTDGQSDNLDIKVLMGKDEPLTYVYAKQIASSLYTNGILQPILLGIAVQDCSPETLKEIIHFVQDNSV